MKILLTNNEFDIAVIKDFEEMDKGLIGQTITELELIIDELKKEYLR